MNDFTVVETAANWDRLKAMVLDSVSSPITKRVYNMALEELLTWFRDAPRPGFTKAMVSAWRCHSKNAGSARRPSLLECPRSASWRRRQPITNCSRRGDLEYSMWRKYRTKLRLLVAFCDREGVSELTDVQIDVLEDYRRSRQISLVT